MVSLAPTGHETGSIAHDRHLPLQLRVAKGLPARRFGRRTVGGRRLRHLRRAGTDPVRHHERSRDPRDNGSLTSSAATATAGEAVISFTYTVDTTASSGGRGGPGGGMARNPYIAFWIENGGGELVKTVALWHLAGQEDRWLSELSTWYSAAGGDATVSSATRAAGSYDVVWDLTDTSGAAVKDGQYTVCIESSREHGPSSLLTMDLALSGKKTTVTGTANNELTAAQVTVTP
jgi:hypothetical protein